MQSFGMHFSGIFNKIEEDSVKEMHLKMLSKIISCPLTEMLVDRQRMEHNERLSGMQS